MQEFLKNAPRAVWFTLLVFFGVVCSLLWIGYAMSANRHASSLGTKDGMTIAESSYGNYMLQIEMAWPLACTAILIICVLLTPKKPTEVVER